MNNPEPFAFRIAVHNTRFEEIGARAALRRLAFPPSRLWLGMWVPSSAGLPISIG